MPNHNAKTGRTRNGAKESVVPSKSVSLANANATVHFPAKRKKKTRKI